MRTARALREELRHAPSEREAATIREVIDEHAYNLRGSPIGHTYGVAPEEVAFDTKREQTAEAFHQLATGQATPIDEYLGQWIGEADYTPRTQADHRRAVQRLKAWGAVTIESMTRKRAGEYVSALLRVRGDADRGGVRKTAAKYKSSLSSYWQWMKGRGLVEFNVWSEQAIAKSKVHLEGVETRERAFTDPEVVKLLDGPADPLTADLIRMGALSGMRIDEICRVTVEGCAAGVFRVTRAKTRAGVRSVPIHPHLRPIVASRIAGKRPQAYLFDELSDPPAASRRERSMPAVKRFGRYMRAQNVAVMIEGKRRSLVNFHSLRRWFVTKAERAGQPEATIASVVGHMRQGMTLGGYSGGPSLQQLRECVEAVRLPKHKLAQRAARAASKHLAQKKETR